jgi:hypothetical protein
MAESGAEICAEIAKLGTSMSKTAGTHGVKAITSGIIDIPSPLQTGVVAIPHNPRRVTDLLLTRRTVDAPTWTCLRQTVATNTAAPCCWSRQKVDGAFTAAETTGKGSVIAHLCQPFPERYLADYPALVSWLESEMENGVLDEIEQQIPTRRRHRREFRRPFHAQRRAVGAIRHRRPQDSAQRPNRHGVGRLTTDRLAAAPSGVQALDLLQDGGESFYCDGPARTPRCEKGVAYLADRSQARLVVREDGKLDADRSGDLFTQNAVILRFEGRFGVEWLRPSSFAEVALTAW